MVARKKTEKLTASLDLIPTAEWRLSRYAIFISMLIGMLGLAYTEDLERGLCFYLPFDGDLSAKTSADVETPQKPVESNYAEGVKGRGLIINGMDTLSYRAKRGYFNFEKGTISLWLKPNYDDVSFRGKVDKDIKTQGWYFSQPFFSAGNWGEVKLNLNIGQNPHGVSAGLDTYPNIQHYKQEKLFLEKDKWINIIFTWNIFDKNLGLYINGSKSRKKMSQLADDWHVPQKVDYTNCTINISGGYLVDIGKKRTAGENNAILKTILPKQFSFTIDEVRIYDRVLEENEIKFLYCLFCPIF